MITISVFFSLFFHFSLLFYSECGVGRFVCWGQNNGIIDNIATDTVDMA